MRPRRRTDFLRDRRGNFAVMGALTGALLVVALGGAVDLSMQYRARSLLQAAVDAGALAGAKELEKDINGSVSAPAKAMAMAGLPADLRDASVTTTVDKQARLIKVAASVDVKPSFLQIMRIDALPVSVAATSSIMQEQHTDFYFMLDVSESMNIAASEPDRIKLEDYTREWTSKYGRVGPRPCAFACHEVEEWAAPISVYAMNELAGKEKPSRKARLRIDVVREASDKMIDKILGENAVAGTLRFNRIATAGFSWDFAKGLGPSTDAAGLKLSIRSFPIRSEHSRFWWAFSSLNAMVGTQGTGETAASPRKVAIVVTDGVRDEDASFGAAGLGPLDPNLCAALKSRGITLAILEIKYVPRDGEYFYDTRVKSYYPKISPNLKSCASEGAYFMATDADEASQAILAMTAQLMDDMHLVN